MIVHDIKVQPVGAGVQRGARIIAEAGEVGGKQTGGDDDSHIAKPYYNGAMGGGGNFADGTVSAVTVRGALRVAVFVRSEHMDKPPVPAHDDDYWFAYHIRIENQGDAPVRLVARRWTITDGENRVREVSGEGVVGEKPYLQPGEKFEYASCVDMPTPVGTMNGAYIMRPHDREDSEFEAEIPMFSLAVPSSLN